MTYHIYMTILTSFNTNKKNIYVDDKNFDINTFNNTFEKYKIDIDPNQKGYGDIMDTSKRNAKNQIITESNKGSISR